MFKFFLYKLGLLILNNLSLDNSYKFATAVSDLQYTFSFRDRRAVRRNLRKIAPGADDLPRMTREVFRNFGRYLVEFFKMSEVVDRAFIAKHVLIEGRKHLDECLDRGKGGIIVTAHLGNWELGAVLLSLLGYPLTAVALPHKERPVNDLFNQRREEKGVQVIPTNAAVRQCIERLNQNQLVALVADRDFTAHGVVTDFLGQRTLIPKGPAMFSWKTGAPIIPVFLIRREEGRFQLICEPPIEPPAHDDAADPQNILKELMMKYLGPIEDQIRKHPAQWLAFRDFAV